MAAPKPPVSDRRAKPPRQPDRDLSGDRGEPDLVELTRRAGRGELLKRGP